MAEAHLGLAASHLSGLLAANRALRVNMAGHERYAAIEDAARLRDALGIPLPMGVPLAFIEPVADPLSDLLGRYARTHGPFTAAEAAARLGLGVAVVHSGLARLAADRRVTEGEFLPSGFHHSHAREGTPPLRALVSKMVPRNGAMFRFCASCAADPWPRYVPKLNLLMRLLLHGSCLPGSMSPPPREPLLCGVWTAY